jgi:predicted GNAT family N-acyltransferase
MATAPSVRGTGVGAALLGACVAHVAEQGGARLWCNARVEAEGFYVRAGFKTETDVWDEPFLGPHIRMALNVSSRP